MKKFEVLGTITVDVRYVIEAENERNAMEKLELVDSYYVDFEKDKTMVFETKDKIVHTVSINNADIEWAEYTLEEIGDTVEENTEEQKKKATKVAT